MKAKVRRARSRSVQRDQTKSRGPASSVIALAALLGACGGMPRVDVDAPAERVTTEAGGRFEIAVSLARKPHGSVTVYAVSSDESEGSVSEPVLLSPDDWSEPHTLTVTGVDDVSDDDDVAYEVAIYVQASWRPHDQQLLQTFELLNHDDENARFEGLGDLPGGERASYATALSAAGDVVVGWSHDEQGERAVRWTSLGLRGLGGAASRAQAVSPNGGLVTGSMVEPTYQGGRAAVLWHHELAYERLEGPRVPPDGPILLMVVDAQVVLSETLAYGTCLQYAAYGEPLACRYDGPGSVEVFGPGHVFAADAQGNFAGTRHAERHAPFHAFATYNGGDLPYPDGVQCSPNMGCSAEARALAGDLAVGTSHVPDVGTSSMDGPPLREHAFTYAPEQGALRLPDLEGGEVGSGAYAVSGDGQVIAGFGSDESGRQAVVWVNAVPIRLDELLLDAGGELPDGWRLLEVRAVSADGRIFAGNGTNPDGVPEAFRLSLPSVP